MGCTTMFVVAIVGLGLLFACSWWALMRFVNDYTSTEPARVALAAPADAVYTSASDKLATIHAADDHKQSVTVAFTADELNALIAQHPDFKDMRGKFQIGIANSILTIDMSVPLREIDVPKIRERWLNGSARIGLVYNEGNFNFTLRSLAANGHEMPLGLLRFGAYWFNKSADEHLRDSWNEEDLAREVHDNVKTLAVIDDKLVVTTKGTEAAPPNPAP